MLYSITILQICQVNYSFELKNEFFDIYIKKRYYKKVSSKADTCKFGKAKLVACITKFPIFKKVPLGSGSYIFDFAEFLVVCRYVVALAHTILFRRKHE